MTVGDAFGELVRSAWAGDDPFEIVERDDGFVGVGRFDYLAPVRRWQAPERRMLRLARGRVLDVGCGAGRVALELQRRGHEVIAIDTSPGCIEVARARGVRDAHICDFVELDARFGLFDTLVMAGNNFGLVGTPARAGRLLRRLRQHTTDGARILATSTDVLDTTTPCHLAYHQRNRSRGRLPGQLRLRVRHRDVATPWFDYLLATPAEMAAIAETGGWRLTRTLRGEGPIYVGVLERTAVQPSGRRRRGITA